MDSMQASLESEQRVKAETLRIKKKLEGDINEFEIALDHANKANNEALKSIKRYVQYWFLKHKIWTELLRLVGIDNCKIEFITET